MLIDDSRSIKLRHFLFDVPLAFLIRYSMLDITVITHS